MWRRSKDSDKVSEAVCDVFERVRRVPNGLMVARVVRRVGGQDAADEPAYSRVGGCEE